MSSSIDCNTVFILITNEKMPNGVKVRCWHWVRFDPNIQAMLAKLPFLDFTVVSNFMYQLLMFPENFIIVTTLWSCKVDILYFTTYSIFFTNFLCFLKLLLLLLCYFMHVLYWVLCRKWLGIYFLFSLPHNFLECYF